MRAESRVDGRFVRRWWRRVRMERVILLAGSGSVSVAATKL